MDYREKMKDYINTEIKIMQNLNLDEMNEAANALTECRKRGGVIYTIGNGGSSATASHFVVDFEKGANESLPESEKPFKFECLADNMPIIAAIANDISYDDIFVYQLKKKLTPNDLLVAISGSGNSKNIIKAAAFAKSIGTQVLGVTGYNGGKLREMSDYKLHVNINDMQITEDLHLMFDHMLLRVFSMSC